MEGVRKGYSLGWGPWLQASSCFLVFLAGFSPSVFEKVGNLGLPLPLPSPVPLTGSSLPAAPGALNPAVSEGTVAAVPSFEELFEALAGATMLAKLLALIKSRIA